MMNGGGTQDEDVEDCLLKQEQAEDACGLSDEKQFTQAKSAIISSTATRALKAASDGVESPTSRNNVVSGFNAEVWTGHVDMFVNELWQSGVCTCGQCNSIELTGPA
jgi:hypothetical protein